MSAEAFTGSNPAAICDGLTTAISAILGYPVEVRLGVLEEARTGAPPRVTFVPPATGGIGTEPARFSLSDRELVSLQLQRFDANLFASSYTDLLAMHAALGGQLDLLLGPKMGSSQVTPPRPGYDFGEPHGIGPVQKADVAGAWACSCPVTLKDFLDRKRYGTAPLLEVDVAITTSDIDGNIDPAIQGGALTP